MVNTRRSAAGAAVCAVLAMLALLKISSNSRPTQLYQPQLVQDGTMLAGWGTRLPGVAHQARAHVYEYGAHHFHDGDGIWQSEQDRRGPWFWEVTPEDHAKLRQVNIDSNGPFQFGVTTVHALAEGIDDPFDDQDQQSNYFSEGPDIVGTEYPQGETETEVAEQAPVVEETDIPEEADIPASSPQEQEESPEEAEKEMPESLPANLVEESTER